MRGLTIRRGTAALATLATGALLAAGLTGTAQAAYPGADGLIAFVRAGNIYTINPQSASPATTVRKLTHDGHDAGPRWSPSGQQIAYLDRGDLWIMSATGSHKTKLTAQAPGYTDSRPTWSPSGRYLAFVLTKRGATHGYLTRYDTVTHKLATFSTPYHSDSPTRRQIKITALPAAVAWAWARNAGTGHGSFIVFEGATAPACPAGFYCLDAVGYGAQRDYRNGIPSAENRTASPVRQLDPDWNPVNPLFSTDVLTTQEKCAAGHCSHTGIDLQSTSTPVLPGAYQAVYSPTGGYLAYVRDTRSGAEIYLYAPAAIVALTRGSQPDWQPLNPS
jgi:hypothetical protein